jgi:hypothetical protein
MKGKKKKPGRTPNMDPDAIHMVRLDGDQFIELHKRAEVADRSLTSELRRAVRYYIINTKPEPAGGD